jgi:hypothetical protein
MTQHGLTASQARTVSTSDLVVYNEIDAINREIVAQALAGNLEATVDDGTTMTESTPTLTVTGTVSDPIVGGLGEALTIAGESVTLIANSDVDQIVAAINDAAIAGLTATKNATQNVVLTYEPPMATWSLQIDADSGNATLGFTAGTVNAPVPDSRDYYDVWSNLTDDRKLSLNMTKVINYFQDQGYNIVQKLNTETGSTFKWEVYW